MDSNHHRNTVYPRWRGEHHSRQETVSAHHGLSPLARGTLPPPSNRHVLPRFIPAGAGNTIMTAINIHIRAVYPRWRGEHVVIGRIRRDKTGLSPLARGTQFNIFVVTGAFRFIPAGAGNTSKSSAICAFLAVYPRWRGEHIFVMVDVVDDSGLSPLARGTRGVRRGNIAFPRFIPAGAGNTRIKRAGQRHTTVYPRWRGEHGY